MNKNCVFEETQDQAVITHVDLCLSACTWKTNRLYCTKYLRYHRKKEGTCPLYAREHARLSSHRPRGCERVNARIYRQYVEPTPPTPHFGGTENELLDHTQIHSDKGKEQGDWTDSAARAFGRYGGSLVDQKKRREPGAQLNCSGKVPQLVNGNMFLCLLSIRSSLLRAFVNQRSLCLKSSTSQATCCSRACSGQQTLQPSRTWNFLLLSRSHAPLGHQCLTSCFEARRKRLERSSQQGVV